MNGTFEWGAVSATFMSVLSIVPRHCPRVTYFPHPKMEEINALPFTPQLTALTLRRARRAHEAFP